MIPQRVRRIDSFFDLVAEHLSFSSINPRNIQKKKQLFQKQQKDPQFTYNKPHPSLIPLRDGLYELHLGETPLELLLEQKRKELIKKIDVLLSIGKDDFGKQSTKLYPLPNKQLVERAYSILSLPPSPSSKKVLRQDGIKQLRKAFAHLNLKYRVKSSDMTTSARVEELQRLLELKKRERFSEDYFKRLVVHEIGTHALRSENGYLQPLKLFKNGFANYLSTEEGLAAYNELKSGVMTNSILRNYAGRVIAVHKGSEEGFLKTYKHLNKYFSDKMAWKLTLRAKRGLADTSKPGAYTKDTSYLRGLIAVLRYAKKNNVDNLYVGKVGIKDLSLLEHIPLVKQPKYVLKNLLSNSIITPSERRIDEEVALSLLR